MKVQCVTYSTNFYLPFPANTRPQQSLFLWKYNVLLLIKLAMTYSPNSYVPFPAKSKKFVKTRAVSNSFFCESTICFVINLAVSYSTIEHRKWIFDISARLLYKGGYECFEEFFVIKKETFIRVSHLSRDTAKKIIRTTTMHTLTCQIIV